MSEIEKLEKQVAWLDEQRRAEAEARARLEERLNALAERMEAQQRQAQELSDEVTRLGTLASRIKQVDDALAKHRKEVSRQLGEAEKRRSAKEDRLESLRAKDQQALRKAIDAIEDQLPRLDGLEQSMQARQKEEIRLQNELELVKEGHLSLSEEVEAHKLTMATFEEARVRVESKADEVYSNMQTVRKKVETLAGQLDQAQDSVRRMDTALAEMRASEEERERLLETWLEDQKMWTAEMEKTWKEWEKRFSQIEETAASTEERLSIYEETYLSVKKIHGELKSLMERLERRITEVSEVQRLAEERLRQEWSAFQSDEVKRWNTFQLSHEEQWREHERRHTKLDELIGDYADRLERVEQVLSALAERDERRIGNLLAIMREWVLEQERQG